MNLDYESEEDMVEKARIGLALQPVATALFANSPFRDGKPSGATLSISLSARIVFAEVLNPSQEELTMGQLQHCKA